MYYEPISRKIIYAPRDDNTLAALQKKHPSAPENFNLPAPPGDDYPASALASVEDVRKSLSSFGPGTASGSDGIRPSHLVALISRKTSEAGVRLLASLILCSLKHNIKRRNPRCSQIRSFMEQPLVALSKNDGGVCPIAVGSTFRRLATKVGSKSMSAEIGDSLRPVQLGYSTRGGCEAAARKYLGEP